MTLDISGAFVMAKPEEHGNHQHDGGEWWQESCVFHFEDPDNDFIGFYRLGMHPVREERNAYYWTSAGTIGLDDKNFNYGLPLNGEDITNTQAAELQVIAVRPMEEYRIIVARPGYRMEATFTPFFWPIMVHSAISGASLAAGHYNAVGKATGFVETADQRVEFDAFGFLDHSWGTRKSHFIASKYIFAAFDEKNFLQSFPVMGTAGDTRHLIGYVCVDGVLRQLTDDFSCGFTMRDDWLTPASCDFQLVDEDGRKLRFTGQSQGPSSLYPFSHGKFCTHVLASFEFNGRRGKGLLEYTPVRAIPPCYVDRYGIDLQGMWIQSTENLELREELAELRASRGGGRG